MGWADGLADGLASGVQIYNYAQKAQDNRQDREWKAEDRQRESDERKQLDEAGKIFGKWEQGDYSPAVAKANSSGMFGPDRFATGARRGEDGNIYATLYDSKNPVDSLQEVNLGKEGDLKNQMVMSNLPPSVLAKVAAAQAQKQSDPAYQQQLRSGELGIKKQEFEVNNQPTNQAVQTARDYAALNHSVTATTAQQQETAQKALTNPLEQRRLDAQTQHAEWLAKNPNANQVLEKQVTGEDGTQIITYRRAGDPPTALAGQNAGAAPAAQPAQSAQQPTQAAQPAAKSAAPTVDAKTYYQGLVQRGVSRDQAKALTLQKFGSK